ncbi:peptide ABC transporter substrate-binding protein [Metabacillus fastidiosus]|uniref:peptide ABC transporter substrate-binding protein n=1 Tax=Metabacillus fastidiosus TaxID=1458 RepID=UPI002DBFEA12|nr:peptide ABC transporter substrate-binding protein [Metabacillus fastidiosus]MEC2074612.1 peptide ABC transporter substrate-binding protein [Metabacillus fastidiosus]
MKLRHFTSLFFVILILSACNNSIDQKEDLGEIYSIALNSIMEQDKELDNGMKFIAIDMSNFNDLDEQAKKEILNFFKEKYKIEVMDATFEELKEQGFYNSDTMSLDGILLRLEKVEFKLNNNIFFEGSKYSSALGAVGVEVTVHYKDDNWKVKEAKMTWVS